MNLKDLRKISLLLTTAIMAVAMTACSNDNDEPNNGGNQETTCGLYIMNSGNQGSNISASITSYNFANDSTSQDAFYNANGFKIGNGLQQAIICDGKMYLALYESNLLWVVEPQTLKVISQIKFEGEANTPRYMVEKDGKIYCSMYTGYVCEIDSKTDKITRTIKVGPNPEKMGIAGNTLYVACSDGQNWQGDPSNGVAAYGNSCISKVNIKDYTVSKVEGLEAAVGEAQAKSLNPTEVATNGTDVFVVSMGDYGALPNTVIKISGDKVEKVCLGSIITVKDNNLYVIYAQYGASAPSYKVYDVNTLQEKGTFIDQTSAPDAIIEYPGAITVDSTTGDIAICSYTLSDAGYAQYSEPSYTNLYTSAGVFKKRINCGVGAISATFIHD